MLKGVRRTGIEQREGPVGLRFRSLAGVGAQYDFTKTIAGRIEAQRFSKVGNSNTGSGDVDFYSAGIVVKF
ncbi:MAG: hypothetical protein WCO67_25845 [Betaproteobacteria bacterium]